jgi:hypothetical protein
MEIYSVHLVLSFWNQLVRAMNYEGGCSAVEFSDFLNGQMRNVSYCLIFEFNPYRLFQCRNCIITICVDIVQYASLT